MELIYLWIEDYRNIKNQGFNFSPKWDIDYNHETDVLTVNEKEGLPENFWGVDNLLNLTAIVGENGAGKTSVLEFLIQCYSSSLNSFLSHKECKHVVFNQHKKKSFLIIQWKGGHFQKSCLNGKKIFEHKTEEQYEGYRNATGYANLYAYYSDTPRKDIIKIHPQNWQNISTSYLLKNFSTNPKIIKYVDHTSQYEFNENEKQINFLNQNKNVFFRSFFPESPYISIDFKYPKFIQAENIINQFPEYTDLINLVKNKYFTSGENLNNYIKRRQIHILQVLTLYLLYYLVHYNPTKKIDYSFFKIDPNISEQRLDKTHVTFLNKLLNDVLFKNQINTPLDQLLKIISREGELSYNKYGYSVFSSYTYIMLNAFDEIWEILISIKKCYIEALKINLENGDFFLFGDIIFFKFQDLSNGQKQLLHFFSRIYSFKENAIYKEIKGHDEIYRAYYKYARTFTIIIDEGEVGLHPQWQKQYINIIVKYLSELFHDKQIQIILTSHSPLILSDIPKSNVIFLKKGNDSNTEVVKGIKKMETFGSNIHSLLADSFFLQGGLIGDFVKGKIEQLLKWINPIIEEKRNWEKEGTSKLRRIQKIAQRVHSDRKNLELLLQYKSSTSGQKGNLSKKNPILKEIKDLLKHPQIVTFIEKKKEINHTINMIGDHVIKNKLSELFALAQSYFVDKTDLEKQIELYEAELKRLKSLKSK